MSAPIEFSALRGARNPINVCPLRSLATSPSVGGATLTTTSAAHASPMLAPAFDIPGYRQQLEERTPLQRIADPGEIARPVRFLLSDEAGWITGANFPVDGGVMCN